MYRDYFDGPLGPGLRNPYDHNPDAPDTPLPSPRQRLVLLGLIGAGLAVVAPSSPVAAGLPLDQAAANGSASPDT